ncbi:putative Myb/SANT-like domain-containing protein [Helianthus annuus]|nr:putative Myb/SANT-like domain-containing protein [Helianthus annuus]
MGKHKHEANGKKEQLKWTENMDNFFIQAMIAQQENGNRVNGNFTTHAYNNMVAELRTKLQMDFTKNHLKNRLKTLKEHFSQWYDMFHGTSLSGFTWNSSTQLTEAEEEVWDKLIEVSALIIFRLVNESNEHERGVFVFVCLSFTEQTIEHEQLNARGFLVRVR